eukprot:6612783-Prymnesium_polylepis.1
MAEGHQEQDDAHDLRASHRGRRDAGPLRRGALLRARRGHLRGVRARGYVRGCTAKAGGQDALACGRAPDRRGLPQPGPHALQHAAQVLLKAPIFSIPQTKTSKVKFLPFLTGAARYSDWYIDWGDSLVMARGSLMETTDEEEKPDPLWLIPELQGSRATSSTITSYTKGVQLPERGVLVKYKPTTAHWTAVVSKLPKTPTATGPEARVLQHARAERASGARRQQHRPRAEDPVRHVGVLRREPRVLRPRRRRPVWPQAAARLAAGPGPAAAIARVLRRRRPHH